MTQDRKRKPETAEEDNRHSVVAEVKRFLTMKREGEYLYLTFQELANYGQLSKLTFHYLLSSQMRPYPPELVRYTYRGQWHLLYLLRTGDSSLSLHWFPVRVIRNASQRSLFYSIRDRVYASLSMVGWSLTYTEEPGPTPQFIIVRLEDYQGIPVLTWASDPTAKVEDFMELVMPILGNE